MCAFASAAATASRPLTSPWSRSRWTTPSGICGPESSSSSISHLSQSPCAHRVPNSPFSAPPAPSQCSRPLPRPRCVRASPTSSSLTGPSPAPPSKLLASCRPPPPLPPKPCHLSEASRVMEGAPRSRSTSLQQFPGNIPLFSRRTSLSGLDHLRRGNIENRVIINRRQSVNLPCLNDTHVQSYQDESYVPMTSPSASTAECDGYIPMSPRTLTFLSSNCSVESSPSLSSLTCQPAEFVPPPVHRHLKPRPRKVRPPPLDLTGLSTITECPTHLPISRTKTQPCFSGNHSSFDYRLENGETPRDEPGNRSAMESRHSFCLPFDGASQYGMSSPSRLDYLSLDFNSATPSPVQKKPFLSDEYRVDYVQVDEKKTQALQNTKMEWTDNRLSKT
ncbi:GRB2-associated-binding protein 3 [Oryzias melastigma]|uniref:GRB2-associated-binding protein 3 n=1 Tax=Oryzias melastigma TaxID=30732 RepID=A0A834BQG4_ORYME|nr:GRB2-associated-binding protein 3 [Oryzias melastigma]